MAEKYCENLSDFDSLSDKSFNIINLFDSIDECGWQSSSLTC